MTTTDTQVEQLVVNRLTKSQFTDATPSDTELWAVDPQFEGGKILATDSNGDIVESTITPSSVGTVKTVNNTSPDSNGNVAITIPTVNNATLTIQKNSTTVDTFTANASSDKTINITVPTNTNELTNGAGFITSSDLTDYQLIAQPVTTLSTSGTITLSDNTVNKITPTGNVTFSLPTVTDLTKFHQILVQLNLSTVYTITLGTTYYFNKTAPDLSATGVYNLIFEYDNANGYWVVGCVPKGAST